MKIGSLVNLHFSLIPLSSASCAEGSRSRGGDVYRSRSIQYSFFVRKNVSGALASPMGHMDRASASFLGPMSKVLRGHSMGHPPRYSRTFSERRTLLYRKTYNLGNARGYGPRITCRHFESEQADEIAEESTRGSETGPQSMTRPFVLLKL